MSIALVYFSNYSGNTKRFIEKIDDGTIPIFRIPIADSDSMVYPFPTVGYILCVPTYGGLPWTFHFPGVGGQMEGIVT